MKRTSSAKKLIVAGLAAATVAGAAFAFANTLTVNSTTLGSGTDPVASPACSPDVSYETTWNTTTAKFDVTKVTADTDAACDGKQIQAALTGSSGSLWSSGAAETIASGTTFWTIDADMVNATDVTNAYATVTG